MKPQSTTGLGLAMGLLVLLAGCSSADDPADASGATDTDSPLAEYLPDGSGMGQGFTVAGSGGEDGEKIQQLVATCMQEQGFDYTPVPSPDEPMADVDVDDRDWVAQYGYGITTADAIMPDPPEDPNAAKVEAMSPAERKAWDKALIGSGGGFTVGGGPGGAEVPSDDGANGPGPDGGGSANGPGSEGGGTPGDGGASGSEGAAAPEAEPQGCLPKASEQVHGDRGQIDTAEFSGLFDDLAALHRRIDSDPRVAEVIGSWSDCLADAGYPGYAAINEPQESIMQQWSELNGWEFDANGDGGIAVQAAEPGDEAAQPDPAKTAELKKQEIALAVADHDCRGDYQKIHDQVRVELEKQFVADHLDQLERYRDVVNGVG